MEAVVRGFCRPGPLYCWTQICGTVLVVSVYMWVARPICLRLFVHVIRLAASRTFCTAGRRRPMRTAMMGMTTSSSISVNPPDGLRLLLDVMMEPPPGRAGRATNGECGPELGARTCGHSHAGRGGVGGWFSKP